MIAWIFFRANSIHQAIKYIDEMISPSLFSVPQVFPVNVSILATLFIFSEWLQRKKEHALQIDNLKVRIVRWIIYYGVVFLILLTLNDSQQSFIYSQF
jgi:hypothetical protein